MVNSGINQHREDNMKYFLLILLLIPTSALADYQINCPSENIIALNQSGGQNVTVGKTTTWQTFDAAYFNTMFKATDCVVTPYTPPPPPTADQIAAQQAAAQAQAQTDALIAQDEKALAIADLQNQGLLTSDQATAQTANLTALSSAQATATAAKTTGTVTAGH